MGYWEDFITKGNPIVGAGTGLYKLGQGDFAGAFKAQADGSTLWAGGFKDPVTGAVGRKLDQEQNGMPPAQNVTDTPAGKQAANFASALVGAQQGLGTPTYGTAPSIPVGGRPTAPGADVYAMAAGQGNTYLAQGVPDVSGFQAGGASPFVIQNGVNGTPSGAPTRLVPLNGAPAGGGASGSLNMPSANPQDPASVAARQQADAQRQIADYEKAAASWDQIYGGQAQQSGFQAQAQQIQAPQNNYQFGMQAPQAYAPQIQGAPQQVTFNPLTGRYDVAAPSQIRAGTVTAQQIGQQQMQAPGDIATNSLGRDAQGRALNMYESLASGRAPLATDALMDPAQRDAQLRAQSLYEGAAMGTAPSAAEALMRRGIDENIGAQLGMAATLQGNTPGLALRAGLAGAQGAVARSAADMAALRAQEQETGRAGFLQATGMLRGQDISQAQARAQEQEQVRTGFLQSATGIRGQDIQIAQSNQTKDLTTAVTNLQARIDVLKANQATALQAGMSNQAADLNAQIQNASNQLEAAKASAANSLTKDIANMTATLDASKANAANAVAQNIANLQAATQITQANLNSALQTGLAGEANRLTAQLENQRAQLAAAQSNQQALLDEAKINAQTAQANAAARQNQQQFTSTQALTANQYNAQNDIQQQAINNNLYLGLTGQANAANATSVGLSQADIQRQAAAQQAQMAADAALMGGIISTAGTVAGGA